MLTKEELIQILDVKFKPIEERLDRIETLLTAVEEKVEGLESKMDRLKTKVDAMAEDVKRMATIMQLDEIRKSTRLIKKTMIS